VTDETALFERALGGAWSRLHPQVTDRYGLVAGEDRQAVGRGTMSRLDRHPLAFPAFRVLAFDDVLVPESGIDVPFTITTTAFVDDAGYEALFLRREFETEPPRQFVDTLRWNPRRECLTDLLGNRGHIAVDINLDEADGALELTLGRQWLRAGGRYLPLPGPAIPTGTLRDWYDDREQFRVAADVESPLLGTIFGYEGHFENSFRESTEIDPGERAHAGTRLPNERSPIEFDTRHS
jgi:hypothetical protein